MNGCISQELNPPVQCLISLPVHGCVMVYDVMEGPADTETAKSSWPGIMYDNV